MNFYCIIFFVLKTVQCYLSMALLHYKNAKNFEKIFIENELYGSRYDEANDATAVHTTVNKKNTTKSDVKTSSSRLEADMILQRPIHTTPRGYVLSYFIFTLHKFV